MSLREFRKHAGQLVIAGFAGHTIPADLKSLAREFDLGGVIFFARNVESPEQVAELSRQARELERELPLWVSVDQEGGRVARLKAPFTVWPPMITLGRSGDDKLVERFARALGVGGKLFAVVGAGLPQEALLVTRTSEQKWDSESLFETAIDPLEHALRPEPFQF
jgi:protein-L-isoaspartate O-methyltransferase